MTRLVDLSRLMDPADRDLLPEAIKAMEVIIAPKIHHVTPDGEGKDKMFAQFGIPPEHLPRGEGWAADYLTDMSTHCGTHVDAPYHSGRLVEGKPARKLDEIGLDELYRPGIVLDLREWAEPGRCFPVEALKKAIAANGSDVRPGDAVLLRTGQEKYTMRDPEFYDYPGMSGDGTRFLTGLGATILGTDSLGWDRPFPVMRQAYADSGDPKEVWDGHFAIRDKEAFIVQQLDNLAALPPAGFMIGCFPLKLPNTSGSPARVIGFVED